MNKIVLTEMGLFALFLLMSQLSLSCKFIIKKKKKKP